MFCHTCGKEIRDNARFCPQCGSVAQQQQNADTSMQTLCLIVVAVITGFVMCTAFLPTMTLRIPFYEDFNFKEQSYSLFQSWKLLDYIDYEIGLDKLNLFRLFVGAGTVLYAVCVILCLKFFMDLLGGERGYELTVSAKGAMWFASQYQLVMILMGFLLNKVTAEQMNDVKLIETPMMGWIMLVVPLINVFVFISAYNKNFDS